MGDELLLDDEVPLVDLAHVAPVQAEHLVVVPVGRREAGVDVVEERVVELHLPRVEGLLGSQDPGQDPPQAPGEQAAQPAQVSARASPR